MRRKVEVVTAIDKHELVANPGGLEGGRQLFGLAHRDQGSSMPCTRNIGGSPGETWSIGDAAT